MQVVAEHRGPPPPGPSVTRAAVSDSPFPEGGARPAPGKPVAVLPEHTHARNTHTAGRSHKPHGQSVKIHIRS